MTTELMLIDDLKIDHFNPYAIPDEDLFSPGIPKMGGYKTDGGLVWYQSEPDLVPSKEGPIACEIPYVGDYSIDFCVKKPQVRNIQPGWAMEYDGIEGRVTSAHGLLYHDSDPIIKTLQEFMNKNWFMILLLGLAIIYLLRK